MTTRTGFSKGLRSGVVLLGLVAMVAACGDDDDGSASPTGTGEGGASVSFLTPSDGETVAGGVSFTLAAEGVTIEPAGEVREGAGHLHVIADAECVDVGDPIPRDVDHVHLGKGQSEGVIYLGPGEHELCVQVGDGAHGALDLTDTVTVEVGVDDQEQWCSVVEEVDVRFEEVDTTGDEFAVQQAGYAGIGRLLDQLLDAVDLVDADVRDEVQTAMETAHAITDAYVDAADVDEAAANLEPVWAGGEPIGSDAAVAWILDTCGVDVDG